MFFPVSQVRTCRHPPVELSQKVATTPLVLGWRGSCSFFGPLQFPSSRVEICRYHCVDTNNDNNC